MKKSIPCFKIEKKSTYSPRQRALCSRQSALCSSRVRSALDETEAMALKPWLLARTLSSFASIARDHWCVDACNSYSSSNWNMHSCYHLFMRSCVYNIFSTSWCWRRLVDSYILISYFVIFNFMFSDIFISKNHLKMIQIFRQLAALADHWNFRRLHDLSYDDKLTYWRSPHGRNLNPSPLFNVGMLNESFSLKETRFSSYHACQIESKRIHVDIFQRWTGAGVDSMKKFI